MVELLKIEVFGIFLAEQGAAPQPGEGHNLDNTVFGWDGENIGLVCDMDIFDCQRIEDFRAGSPADGIRQVMVPDEQKDGNVAAGNSVYPFGEFSLLGLARFTAFVGVTGK